MDSTKTARAAVLGLGLALAACGGDNVVTTPTTPPPDVAGAYYTNWTLQVLRKSDGFQTSFYCSGQLTLVQASSAGSTAPLSGFAVVQGPCAPESYDLTGTVTAGGGIEFTTNGPPPLEGPCPGGVGVKFTGQVTSQDGWHSLSARGVTTVQCPQFGEHEFTYLIQGSR
jgi:hypothetical protein